MGRDETVLYRFHRWMSSYETPLMLQVSEPLMGYLAKLVGVVVMLYVLFATISQHSYMKFEVPTVAVNPYPGSSSFKTALAANASAPYCNNPVYDYTYSSAWIYKDNQCRNTGGALPEIYSKSKGVVNLVTYYSEYDLLPDGRYASEPQRNYFYPHVEEVWLYFDHVMDSRNIHGSNVKTSIEGQGSDKVHYFEDGDTVAIKVKDLVELAWLSLDDENKNSGGSAPPVGGKYWPSYRLTGLGIAMKMEYANTYQDSPMKSSKTLRINVRSSTEGSWTSKGPRILTVPQADGRFKMVERYEYGLTINYHPAGKIGQFEFFSLLYSVTVMVALVMISTFVITSLSHVFVKSFNSMKSFTENHWLAIEALTYKAREEGWLQDAAMALGVDMEAPRDSQRKIAAFTEAKEGPKVSATRLGATSKVAPSEDAEGTTFATISPEKPASAKPAKSAGADWPPRGSSGSTFFYNDI